MNLINNRDVSRIEAFSDGVFAISATLLVVSLEVPESFSQIVTALYGFIAFALSFAMLIFIWSLHNAFFRRYNLQDAMTIVWNSILLFVVLFYVYPLKYISIGFVMSFIDINAGKLISSFAELQQLFIIYGAGFVAVFASFGLLYRHALKKSAILDLDELDKFEARSTLNAMLIYVGVGLFSIFLAITAIGLQFALPGWIYGLLGPLHYMHDRRYEKKKQQLLVSNT